MDAGFGTRFSSERKQEIPGGVESLDGRLVATKLLQHGAQLDVRSGSVDPAGPCVTR